MVERWPFDFGPRNSKHRDGWTLYLAHDFGVSAPSVTYVVGKSPGIVGPDGRYYPRGSKVLLDELSTNEPNSLERGMGYTVPVLADRSKSSRSSGASGPEGVADDAIFAKTGSGAGSLRRSFGAAACSGCRRRRPTGAPAGK